MIEVTLKGSERIEKTLENVPKEARTLLRRSVNEALKTAHKEALIQISRRYTIGMNAVEKNLREITAKGGSIVARLTGRGRPRGASNFDISPTAKSVTPAWTAKTGYTAQILRGDSNSISNDYFWIRLKGGNIHLARREDPSSRGKDFRIFRTVSTPQMLGNEEVSDKVIEATRAKLEEVFARGMQRRMRGN